MAGAPERPQTRGRLTAGCGICGLTPRHGIVKPFTAKESQAKWGRYPSAVDQILNRRKLGAISDFKSGKDVELDIGMLEITLKFRALPAQLTQSQCCELLYAVPG